MSWPVARLSALGTAAALVSGCGGDPPPVPVRGRVLDVVATDYRYRPQDIRAPRGRLTVRVRNEGRLSHTLNIRGERRVRLTISSMLPGESDSATVRLPRGEWRIFCSIGNHEELGMTGTLVTVR